MTIPSPENISTMSKRTLQVALATALATFAVYVPALLNQFVNWDDDLYITDNPHIRSIDASFFHWAFLEFHASNWHPLTWISHAADRLVWGFNPMGHHFTSISIHAFNALLVVILVSRLLKAANANASPVSPRGELRNLVAAGMAGILFGLHPLHVESAAWVSERKDLLCGTFYLLSLISYLSHTRLAGGIIQNPVTCFTRSRHYLAALFFFLLALLSKPMAVTLPVVLLLIDWYPLSRVTTVKDVIRAAGEKLPFLFLSLASSIIAIAAQHSGDSLIGVSSVSLPVRLLLALQALAMYLVKTLVPFNLLPFYPHPIQLSSLSMPSLMGATVPLIVTLLCLYMLRREKLWIAVWGYYVVTLLPVLGILQVGGQWIADRYMYLPSLGPFLLVGLAAGTMTIAVDDHRSGRRQTVRLVARIVTGAVLAVLAFLTISQIGIWRSSITLWDRVIEKAPDTVPLAYYNRGQIFMKSGELGKAIADYSAAISINPAYFDAVYNRGIAYDKAGSTDLAITDFEHAASLKPSRFEALNNLGISYAKSGRTEEAMTAFNRAIRANPADAGVYFNRGITAEAAGQNELAISDFSSAIARNGQFAPAYMKRAALLMLLGREKDAAADLQTACNLGMVEACPKGN